MLHLRDIWSLALEGDILAGVKARLDGRRIAALAAAAVASAASLASLDTAAPPRTFTGTLPAQSVVVGETSPPAPITLHVTSTELVSTVTLTIQLTANWTGAADAGEVLEGPIVEATITRSPVATPGGPVTLDRAITADSGMGELIVSAEESCSPTPTGCSADFTFTLGRVEPVPSGPVSVIWTPTAAVIWDTDAPLVRITVKP